MGACQSAIKENKQSQSPSIIPEKKEDLALNQPNHEPKADSEFKNSLRQSNKNELNEEQIDLGMNNEHQQSSPSKAVVDSPLVNQNIATTEKPVGFNVTCPNCLVRIPKIESINYNAIQMTYVIRLKCFCLEEIREYSLNDFKIKSSPKVECDIHPGQHLTCYCNQCLVDLCQKCADQWHSSHQLTNAMSHPPLSIDEFKQVLQEQSIHFTREYSRKEEEFLKQCDELRAFLVYIRLNGLNHLKSYQQQHMTLFDFVNTSYALYQHYESQSHLSVGMINFTNDLAMTKKYNPSHIEAIKFNLSNALTNAMALLQDKANDYGLALNYDLFEKQANQRQYSCSNTLQAHSSNIICLFLLNDGRLASGSYDHTIKLWDLRSNSSEVLTEKGNVLSLLEFTPGKLLAATSEREIRLWDIASKKEDFVFQGHCLWVNCLVKINQEVFASGSNDKTIRVWDYYSKKYLKTLKMHTDCILSMCLLNDGFLASGSADNSIRIWKVSEGTCTNWLKDHKKWVKCLCWLSSGRLISGSDDQTIKVWEESKCIATLQGHQDSVRTVCQINSSQFVSGSFDKSIKIWNMITLECEQTLISHSSLVICIISIDNNSFVSCSDDKTIKTWVKH